jgi:hypothetical protein
MTKALEILHQFDRTLHQTASSIANRLQSGLIHAEIEAQIASFPWTLPQAAFELYQWHNGLSGKPEKLNLIEKLIRLKGKWHGELSGRENEVHLRLENRLIVVKFLPLDYALAGHRHLKLGRCSIDLLPVAILTDGAKTFYCMMRLDPDLPIVYFANGTNLPPLKITELFLATQPQFSTHIELIAFLNAIFQQGIKSVSTIQESSIDTCDCEFSLAQIEQLFQQYKH